MEKKSTAFPIRCDSDSATLQESILIHCRMFIAAYLFRNDLRWIVATSRNTLRWSQVQNEFLSLSSPKIHDMFKIVEIMLKLCNCYV